MTLQLFNRDLPFLTKLAQKILSATQSAKSFRTEIVPAQGKVGSGAYPVAHIDSVAIKINSPSLSAEKLARKFRLNPIPIFGYIENDTFFLNMLTVLEKDIPDIIFALNTI
jgi:seryl-tRNA(Sec) selenium transferase